VLLDGKGVKAIDMASNISTTLDVRASNISSSTRYMAIGLADGKIAIASQRLELLASVQACTQRVAVVNMIEERSLLAFGCVEGGGGVALYSSNDHKLTVVDKFHTEGELWKLATWGDAANLIAISDRVVYNYNIDTKITTRMEGQGAMVSAVGTPIPASPHILVGDVNGAVRIWGMPSANSRVLMRASAAPFGVRFSCDGRYLAIYGRNPIIELRRMSDGVVRKLEGHTDMVGGVHFSPDGRLLMSFSWDGTARVWRTSDGILLRTFSDHRSIVEDGDFVGDGQWVVTAGDDGSLYRWKSEGSETELLFSQSTALTALEVVPGTDAVVVQSNGGGLWAVSPGNKVRQLRRVDGIELMSLRASQSGALVATGQEDGVVTVYRTQDWTQVLSMMVGGTIARVELDPLDRDMVAVSEEGFVRAIPLDGRRLIPWQTFKVKAEDITYAPDGERIAISARGGGTWFYSLPGASWRYQHDHQSELVSGRFLVDGEHFVSVDQGGLVIITALVALARPTSR
jgi:WD40 repeat protein